MTISLIFCLVVVLLLVMCIVILLLMIRNMQQRQSALEENIYQINELNARLRANRHDYLNNLQIVYGMLEMKEYEELHAYLEPMYKDIMKISKALKTSIPAVNALLMAKAGEAEKQNINFYIEVKSNLKGIAIPDWELCCVLSNLIDNGFRAVQEKWITNSKEENEHRKGEADNKVIVDINENAHQYIFTIIDNGVSIPKELEEKMFQQGFTTKKQKEGHGMGLYLVSRIVSKYKGGITFSTVQEEKNFQIVFEKSEKGGCL